MQHDPGVFDRAVADPCRDLDLARNDGMDDPPNTRLGRGALRGMIIGAPLAAALWGLILLIGWMVL